MKQPSDSGPSLVPRIAIALVAAVMTALTHAMLVLLPARIESGAAAMAAAKPAPAAGSQPTTQSSRGSGHATT